MSSIPDQICVNYISEKRKVLLFVINIKLENVKATPYITLGNGRYVSHEKEKPIQIIWKMALLITENIIKDLI